MTRKEKILYIVIIICLFGLAYLIWCNITLADNQELNEKKLYLEQLREQNRVLSGKIEDCEEQIKQYKEEKIYLEATIEEKENNIANELGLVLQR